MPLSLKRGWRNALFGAVVLSLGIATGWSLRESEAQEDAAVLAEAQLTRFHEALAGKGKLDDVLGDAFQLMRTDGTRYDREGYLARPASLSGWKLADIKAIQSGDLLTATYFSSITAQIEGAGIASEGDPRLVVFTRVGGEWKLQAFATLGLGLMVNPDAQGRAAVEAWVGAVVSGDLEKVRAVLAPEFQIVRADGTAYDKEAYLQSDLPRFDKMPEIETLVVTGYGDYLVARYIIPLGPKLGSEEEQLNGPRLTVFRKSGQSWLVVAHANFASILR